MRMRSKGFNAYVAVGGGYAFDVAAQIINYIADSKNIIDMLLANDVLDTEQYIGALKYFKQVPKRLDKNTQEYLQMKQVIGYKTLCHDDIIQKIKVISYDLIEKLVS